MYQQVLHKQQFDRHTEVRKTEASRRLQGPQTSGDELITRLRIEAERNKGTLVRLGEIGLTSTIYHYAHRAGKAVQDQLFKKVKI